LHFLERAATKFNVGWGERDGHVGQSPEKLAKFAISLEPMHANFMEILPGANDQSSG
jgi:hypothetical protein